jgi:hypothetical protein
MMGTSENASTRRGLNSDGLDSGLENVEEGYESNRKNNVEEDERIA